jgi:hypothetical protein
MKYLVTYTDISHYERIVCFSTKEEACVYIENMLNFNKCKSKPKDEDKFTDIVLYEARVIEEHK